MTRPKVDIGALVELARAAKARAAAATQGPLVVEKAVHERFSVHYAIRTRDKLPEHPWSARYLAWLCGSLGQAQNARQPSEYRDDPQIEADANLFASAPVDIAALADGVDIEAILALAADTKALDATATKGPWKWWTSCSFRRLKTQDEKPVAEPHIQQSDGCPDIAISEEDQRFIEHTRTAAPALADGVIALAAENARLHRLLEKRADVTFGPFDHDEAAGTSSVEVADAAGVGSFLFGAMAGLLEGLNGGHRAHNYITMAGWHPVVGRIECTIQRVGKLSPHEARRHAEQHLARAVALLRVHGIAWDGPTEFEPVAPDELERDPTADDATPWVRINARERPNRLECRRCGAHQEMPKRGTGKVLQALMKALSEAHADCQDGDAAALGTVEP